jgi:hypothetical protein
MLFNTYLQVGIASYLTISFVVYNLKEILNILFLLSFKCSKKPTLYSYMHMYVMCK